MTATLETEETAVDLDKALSYVAGKIGTRYRRFVETADVRQELAAYIYSPAGEKAQKNTDTLFRALFSTGRRYAEEEKAQQSGYSFEDLAWYTPVKLADLLPMALNPDFDGTDNSGESVGGRTGIISESGNLTAMVVDVRRALGKVGPAGSPVGSDEYEAWLGRLSEALGGSRPGGSSFRRRAQSNASAIALTQATEESEVRRGRDN